MSKPLKSTVISRTKINDKLFSVYCKQIPSVVIPMQWAILNDQMAGAEPTHCIENFRIAAGEKEGLFQGVVFQDSDVYKWLETVAYCIENGSGVQYEEIADGVIDLLARAQQPDGYLNTYFTIQKPESRFTNLIEGHELYCAGHLIEAATAYYEATGKDKLLHIAQRFADLIAEKFGPDDGQIKGYPGHQEIELALIRLYRCTGQRKYLAIARYFIDERGSEPNYFLREIETHDRPEFFPEFADYDLSYSQSHKPPRSQRTAEGHAVRCMYMCSAMADLASEYCDKELEEACLSIWENVTNKRMYLTGGIGSSGHLERFTVDYDLPNESANAETCASIGLAMFGRRMAVLEDDAKYYDVVERELFNTVLAGMSLDGKSYFYVNPLEVWPSVCKEHTSMQHVKPVRQRWFSVACCPPNIARTLASLGQYIFSEKDGLLYINTYISASIDTYVNGTTASVVMDTDIFDKGIVKIEVNLQNRGELPVMLRIPAYVNDPVIYLNDEEIRTEKKNGYIKLICSGIGLQIIRCDFHISPRFVAANTEVREDVGKIALMLGPCVYCLEEVDNGDLLSAVYVSPDSSIRKSSSLSPVDMPELNYAGHRISRRGTDLYSEPQFDISPVKLKAVPYCIWGNRGEGEMLVWQKVMFR
ncbi:MAG: glycoside hydrolase family 127 protein [Flexilinea sp.]